MAILHFAFTGSSPLARGLLLGEAVRGLRDRIIPARAGFTGMLPTLGVLATDHPRSRGVYVSNSSPACCHVGSSPLARGLPRLIIGSPTRCRIIPARAGFTALRRSGPWHSGDHPRSRGVYKIRHTPTPTFQGSSPLARGLRGHPLADGRLPGIIPARAGFTPTGRYKDIHRWDHPRSRGVYAVPREDDEDIAGSSPLARGLRQARRQARADARIIPARAGFTVGRSRRCAAAADHPRSRGVYPGHWAYGRPRPGSSPLARGLPQRLADLDPPGRIIPARAGFT